MLLAGCEDRRHDVTYGLCSLRILQDRYDGAESEDEGCDQRGEALRVGVGEELEPDVQADSEDSEAFHECLSVLERPGVVTGGLDGVDLFEDGVHLTVKVVNSADVADHVVDVVRVDRSFRLVDELRNVRAVDMDRVPAEPAEGVELVDVPHVGDHTRDALSVGLVDLLQRCLNPDLRIDGAHGSSELLEESANLRVLVLRSLP